MPNIAYYLINSMPEVPLKGIAVGNGCWGGDATNVNCNGPNSNQNDVDMCVRFICRLRTPRTPVLERSMHARPRACLGAHAHLSIPLPPLHL